MVNVGITSPIYIKNDEHLKYLNLTTQSFASRENKLTYIACENYIAPEFFPIQYVLDKSVKLVLTFPDGEQSVAKGWNTGINKAKELGLDYVLVVNNDIVLKSNAIDRLVAFAENHPEACMWTMSEWADLSSLETCPEDENFNEHPHFSCYMVKPSILDTVGLFDENFKPAYCEDGDYHYRIKLSGGTALIYGGAKFFHYGSRTIKSDREEWNKNSITFPKNQEYFLKKWGHPVVGDVNQMPGLYYKTPFNDPNKTWGSW